jgi:hypothetical protein
MAELDCEAVPRYSNNARPSILGPYIAKEFGFLLPRALTASTPSETSLVD